MLRWTRTLAVGVLGVDDLGRADTAGLGVERPVQRVAEDRRRRAGLRVGLERQRPGVQARDAEDGDVVVRIERQRVGGQVGRVAAELDGGVALPGDDVRVRDDDTRGRDPAASLDPEPARGPDACARRCRRAPMTPLVRRIAAFGRATSASGPVTDGSGSKRASALRIPPDGGSSVLSSWRIADCCMSRRSGIEPEASSATAPTIHAIPSPTHAVSAAPSSPSIVRSPGRRSGGSGMDPESLKATREHPAGEQRAEQTEQRRVLRVRSTGQQQRSEPRADERAEPEADERQRTDDEALHVAVEGEQRRERNDQPVDAGHPIGD